MIRRAALAVVVMLAVACGVEGAKSDDKGASAGTYKNVDEVMSDPAAWVGKTIKVRGSVTPGSIVKAIRPDGTFTRFDLEHSGATLIVQFKAPTPDTFRDNAEVIVTGTLESRRGAYQLRGTEMLAKHPHDYKPPK